MREATISVLNVWAILQNSLGGFDDYRFKLPSPFLKFNSILSYFFYNLLLYYLSQNIVIRVWGESSPKTSVLRVGSVQFGYLDYRLTKLNFKVVKINRNKIGSVLN